MRPTSLPLESEATPRSVATPDARVAGAGAGRLSWAGAQLAAWAVLAALSLVLTAMRAGPMAGGFRTRLLLHFFDTGQLLAAGVVIGTATMLFRARGSRSMVWAMVATLAASFTLGWIVFKDDLEQGSNGLSHIAPPMFWRLLFTLACATTIPGALLLGRLLGARLRVAGVLGGVALFIFSRTYVLPPDVPGSRLFEVLRSVLAIASAALIGGSFGGARLPALFARLLARRTARRPAGSSIARSLPWALSALWGAYAVLLAPPAQVLFELLKRPAAVLAPFIAELHAPPLPPERTPEEVNDALRLEPTVPPSRAALLPADGVVVLVTIDCLRADVIATDAHAELLPNLTAFRRSAANFTDARSAGNMTIVALGSLFTGRYESQLAWSEQRTLHSRYPFPNNGASPRFPAVLGAAGVPSMAMSTLEWLNAKSGILRGFTEEKLLSPTTDYAKAEDVMTAAVERVERHGAGPLFLYMHLLDAHHPYTRGGLQGTEYERYLRELAIVDRELGRLITAVDQRLGKRAIMMISADHGEGFGEHQSLRHGNHVYDEVVRVPLLVRGAGVVPRAIADSVSLIDLGPTVLDLFRVATPASFMGHSFVPALAGEPLKAPHPIAVESHGQVALIDGGWKMIQGKRYGTIELYNLTLDPEEKDNVYRENDPAAVARLQAMEAFFADVRTR